MTEGISHLVLSTRFVLKDKCVFINIVNPPSMLRIDTRLRTPVLKGLMIQIYNKFMREKVISPMVKGLKQSVQLFLIGGVLDPPRFAKLFAKECYGMSPLT